MTHNDTNSDANLRANTCRSALFCDLYERTIAQAFDAGDGLPPAVRGIEKATQGYPVEVSAPLTAAQQALRARLSRDGRRDDH